MRREILSDSLIAVRNFGSYPEAQVALSALEAEEIEATLRAETFGGGAPEVIGSTGGIMLLVASSDAERAKQILDAPPSSGHIAEISTPVNCAECGRPLPSATTACANCNEDDDRELMMTPQRSKFALVKFKLAILIITLAVMLAPEIFGWFEQKTTGMSPTTFYAAGGIALVLIAVTMFARRSEQRL